jgi:hypothetical protein
MPKALLLSPLLFSSINTHETANRLTSQQGGKKNLII